MRSTMQDHQLTVYSLFKHGAAVYRNSRLAAFDGQRVRRTTYEETASRVARLASGLQRLGIRPGDRVGSFCWNTLEHLEAYFAVPGMGAVLHTLNSRLFPDQLSYIVNHAEDRAIIVDASLVPVLAKVAAKFRTVEHYIVIGPSTEELPEECVDYGEMLAAGPAHFEWPALDERAAAAMCYTSGTTGNPKGVVYSHRSIYLHSMAVNSANCLGLSQHDRLLVGPSMFHANSWGLPHSAWMAGSDMVFPNRFLQPEPLCRLIAEERCTVAGGVPAIWMEVLRYADSHAVDLSSLRLVVCGGSAVPRNLIENFQQRHGLRILQLWGMTETSPVAAIAHPPKGCPNSEELDYRAKVGGRSQGLNCAWSTATIWSFPPTANRSVRFRRAGLGSPVVTTAKTPPTSSMTAGCVPMTWGVLIRSGTSRSRTEPRTSLNPGGMGLFRRTGKCDHGASRRVGGGGDRGAGFALGRAPTGVCGVTGGDQRHFHRARRVPCRARCEVVDS